MLKQMVTAKTGYTSPELWKEALEVTKADVQAHRSDFNSKTKAEQLEYVSNVMAVYIIMANRY